MAVFRSSQNSGRRATSPFTDYWHCLNIPTFRRSFGTRIWRWDRMQSEVEYEHKNQLLLHRFDGPHVGHGIRNMVPTRSAGTGHGAEVRGRSILAQNSSQMGSRAPRWGMHRCSGAFIHLAPPGRAVDVDGKRSKRRNGGGSSGDGIRS